VLKHIDCGGDLSVFAGDDELLFACNRCGHSWRVSTSATAMQANWREFREGLDSGSDLFDRAQRLYPEAFGD
jgi:hypothetical protein